MIAAITVWQHRIAPVFDAAHRAVLVDASTGAAQGEVELPAGDLPGMAATLRAQRVEVVVCGAISRAAGAHLLQAGCTLMACVAGDIDEVIEALCSGALSQHALRLPPCPCCGHGKQTCGPEPSRRGVHCRGQRRSSEK